MLSLPFIDLLNIVLRMFGYEVFSSTAHREKERKRNISHLLGIELETYALLWSFSWQATHPGSDRSPFLSLADRSLPNVWLGI